MIGDSLASLHSSNHKQRERLPHEGELRRVDETNDVVSSTGVAGGGATAFVLPLNGYELKFSRDDFEFAQRLFAILDSENAGTLSQATVQEFTTLRCPVFWRRDEDLRKLSVYNSSHPSSTGLPSETASIQTFTRTAPFAQGKANHSPTFTEIWTTVCSCARGGGGVGSSANTDRTPPQRMGIEGWLVFCRFIALAQYLEAKRRFSARHLQQTMRHRNAPRGSEMVVVDVPPPQPPASLTLEALMECEERAGAPLPVPELDLDHSLLAVHDAATGPAAVTGRRGGTVHVQLIGQTGALLLGRLGNSSASSSSLAALDFAISYAKDARTVPTADDSAVVMVRRSMSDLKWLDDSFATQKVLGGTLCGRILPVFPAMTKSHGNLLRGDDVSSSTSSLLTHTTQQTLKVAKKGFGKIGGAAKSFLGSTMQVGSMLVASTAAPLPALPPSNDDASTTTTTTLSSTSPNPGQTPVTRSTISKPPRPTSTSSSTGSSGTTSFDSFYNAHSPAARARQIERYLNYLLEHPSLSTSFPLNTILMASQSGLVAAKKALHDCVVANKELQDQAPRLDDGKLRLPVPFLSIHDADYGWVRTAAQAAIALRIHGMLETTGMPSASARLQHASLPSFSGARRWDDIMGSEHHGAPGGTNVPDEMPPHVGFEDGVVQVSSELRRHSNEDESDLLGLGGGGEDDDDDGYDLLPLPVPAPERRILMAGSATGSGNQHGASASHASQEVRFHYGSSTIPDHYLFGSDEDSTVLLGSLSIDDNIDKLREVIGSVENTLRRCLASGGGIGKVRRDRNTVLLDVVKGFDSWEGMRGQFISQRSLLKGVNGLQQSKEIYEEGDVMLIDDLSWQSSLARSAVSAAEDVRSAVRASNTAANAKAAASSAAMTAQNACDSGNFSNIEEAKAAQTRASIAQSHAIHAAVVDHEAKSVKRRAAVALANDVKCWNVHRKRELLCSALSYARAQHEATRRAVDGWSCLRDGYIGSVVMPPLYDRPLTPSNRPPRGQQPEQSLSTSSDLFGSGLDGLGSSPRYTTDPGETSATIFGAPATHHSPPIVAVDHHDLQAQPPPLDLLSGSSGYDAHSFHSASSPSASKKGDSESTGDVCNDAEDDASKSPTFFDTHAMLPFATASPVHDDEEYPQRRAKESPENEAVTTALNESTTVENNSMTQSMQSLVDGLMTWGGTVDIEEELVLPRGMAASIVLESSPSSPSSPSLSKSKTA